MLLAGLAVLKISELIINLMKISISPMYPREDRVHQHNPEIFGTDITTYRTTYKGQVEGEPQILLVEQPVPGSVLLSHYHASDQFQLFIDGDGKLGSHDIHPISIHYTNRFTGYGPIIAGDHGINYYVLRPKADPLGPGQYLFKTETRDYLKQKKNHKRTFVVDALEILSPHSLAELSKPDVKELFKVPDDAPDAGILAQELRIGPHQNFSCHDPLTGGGQVLFVLQGELTHEGVTLASRGAVTASLGDAAISFTTGYQGVQALLMQYPKWTF